MDFNDKIINVQWKSFLYGKKMIIIDGINTKYLKKGLYLITLSL